LSDLIGFQYQRSEPQQAADDLLGKLEAIGQATGLRGKAPPLVSLILDGENCWEYYPDGGVHFLRAMYRGLAKHPHIRTQRVSQYVDKYPATDKLGHLFAGSWISHNFAIWIGQPAGNRAWDLLSEARAALVTETECGRVAKALLARAWEELYIAEGSDWFWWFDQHHSSSQDWLFDQLFRRHLQNVYALLDREPPAVLARPIGPERAEHPGLAQPTGLLQVKINGCETYFEWINAGRVTATAARGTMTMADEQVLTRLHFGFDDHRLLLRFDTAGSARLRLANFEQLRIVMVQPAGYELLVSRPGSARPAVQLFHNDVPVSSHGGEAACDHILELGIAWRSLAPRAETPLHFFAELLVGGQAVQRIPHEGAVETFVPSADYELMMWQA
jgi:alpha-amylase/alpha-mannosidase (GH57 family)